MGLRASRASRNPRNARRFLDKLLADMPFPSIQVDGGSEADFERECRQRGLLPPPELNGHAERGNGAWRFYVAWDLPNDGIDDVDRWVDAFADEFNAFRPHQALDGQTPAECPLTARETPCRCSERRRLLDPCGRAFYFTRRKRPLRLVA